MNFEELKNLESLKNPELQEKLRAAKTPEDVLQIAKEEGYELSEEELNSVAGGSWKCDDLELGPCHGYM